MYGEKLSQTSIHSLLMKISQTHNKKLLTTQFTVPKVSKTVSQCRSSKQFDPKSGRSELTPEASSSSASRMHAKQQTLLDHWLRPAIFQREHPASIFLRRSRRATSNLATVHHRTAAFYSCTLNTDYTSSRSSTVSRLFILL